MNAENLMRQAPMTVQTYLNAGVEAIDAAGVDDPEGRILAAFILACAKDFETGVNVLYEKEND